MEGSSQSVKTVLKKKVIVITPDQLARMGLADKVQNAIAEQLKNKSNSQTPPRAIIREAKKLIKVTPLNAPASEDAPRVINGIQDVLMQTAPPKDSEITIVKSTIKHRKDAKEAPVDQVDHALNHNIKCKLKELLSKKLGGEGANPSPRIGSISPTKAIQNMDSSKPMKKLVGLAPISPTKPTQISGASEETPPNTSSPVLSSKPIKKLVGIAPILPKKPTQTTDTSEKTTPNNPSAVSSSKSMKKLVGIAPILPTKPTLTSGTLEKTTPNISSQTSSSNPMKKSGGEPTISPSKPSSTPPIICYNIPSSSPNSLKKFGGYDETAPTTTLKPTPSNQVKHSVNQEEASSSFCTSTPSKSAKKSGDPDDITISTNSSNVAKLTPIKKLGARDDTSKSPPSKPFSIPHIIRLKKAPDEMVQSYPNYGTYHQLPIDQFSIEESPKRMKSTPTVIEEQISKANKVQVLQKVVITPPSLKFTAIGEEIEDRNIKVVKSASPLIDILENIKLESSNTTKNLDSNTKIAPTIIAINEESSEEILTKSSNITPINDEIKAVTKENATKPKIQINPRIRGFRRKLGLQPTAGISNPRAKLRAMYSKKLQENNAQLKTLQKEDEEVDTKSNEEGVIKIEKGGTKNVERIHETLNKLAEKHRRNSLILRAEENEEVDSKITAENSTMRLEETPIVLTHIEDTKDEGSNVASTLSKTMECTSSLKEECIINKEESKEIDDNDNMDVTTRSSTKYLEENPVESPHIEESTPKRRTRRNLDSKTTGKNSTMSLDETPIELTHIEDTKDEGSNVASTSSKAMECTPSLKEECIINKEVSSNKEEENKEIDDDDNTNVTARGSTKHLEETPVESPHIEESTAKGCTRRNLVSKTTGKNNTVRLEETPIELTHIEDTKDEGFNVASTSSKAMECTPSLKEECIINKEVSLNKEEENKEIDDDDDNMNVTASSTKHLEENPVESPHIEESTPKRRTRRNLDSNTTGKNGTMRLEETPIELTHIEDTKDEGFNVASTSSKAMECNPSLKEECIINKDEENKKIDDDDNMNVTARSSTKHLEEAPVESPHIEESIPKRRTRRNMDLKTTGKNSTMRLEETPIELTHIEDTKDEGFNVASTSSKAMECNPSLKEECIINKDEENKEIDDDDNMNVTARSSTKHLEENPVESPHIEENTTKRRARRNVDVTGIFEFTKTEKNTVIDILKDIEETQIDFKAPKRKVKEEETIDDESANEIKVPKKRGRKKKILEDVKCEEATVIAKKTRGRKRKLWISESSDEDAASVNEETASASLIASTPTEQTSCEETPDLKRLKVDESITPKKRRGRPRKSDVKFVEETPQVLGKRLRSSINYAALENGEIEDLKPIRTQRIAPETRPNIEEGVTEKKRRGRPKKIRSEENNEPKEIVKEEKEIVKEEKAVVKEEEEIEEDDKESEDEGRQVGFRKRGRKKKPVVDADEEGKEEDIAPRKRGKKRTLNLGPEVVEEYERKYDSMLKYIFKDIEQCLLKKAAESRPEEAAKEKKKGKLRVCAICKAHLKETEWTNHKLRYHNCLAWREGDKPLNFENTNALMIILNQMYKQRKPFYCDSCNAMKKSPNGFLAHRLCCGELPENHDEFKVRCPECPLSIVPFVYAEHLRGHKLKREKEESKAAEEIEKMSESVTETSTHKRRAAAKKANELIQSFSQEEAKGPCNSNNLDNYYIKNQMRLFRFDIAFKRDLTVGGASKCRFVGCKKSFRVADEALDHLRSCEFVPKTAYICKICSFVYNSEDAINSHLLDSHERCVKRDEDYNRETESEEEDEDFAAQSDSESLVSSAQCSSKKNYKGAKWTPNPNELWKPYNLHFLKQSAKYVEGLSPLLSTQPYQWALEFCDANYNRLGRLLSMLRRTEWTPLNPNYIQNYLPPTMISAAITHVVNSQKSAPKSFAFKKYKLFETHALCNENILGFCGGPINTMAWAPTPNDQPHCEQILAVSVLHDPDKYHYQSRHYNDRGAIQFWNYGVLRNGDKCAGAKLEFCLAHELGGVWCMEWCPSGCYETDGKWLGLLAVCSSDSFVYGYSIPQPNRLKDKMFKPAPVFKLAACKSTDWKLNGNDFHAVQLSWSKASGHKYIAAGYSSGVIGLFNLETTSDLLRTVDDNETAILQPYLSFQAHQHGITGLCLHHLNGGNRWMVSSSYDGYVKLWDLERMPLPASVTRRAQIKDLQWLNNALHTIEARDETSIPSCHPSTANIFRNFASQHTLSLMYGNATLDAVSASEWCNIVVQGSGMGEITACAVKNFFPFSTELTLKRLFIGTVNLERISGGTNMRKYTDVTKTHGIVFVDEPMTRYHPMAKSSEAITSSRSKFAIPKPDRYPLEAINSIAMNPNRYSFLHAAVGYQAGFVKLVHFKCFTEAR